MSRKTYNLTVCHLAYRFCKSSYIQISVNLNDLSQASVRRQSLHNSINTVPQVKSNTICSSSLPFSHLDCDRVKRPSSGWMTVTSITHHYYIINLNLNLNDVNFKNAYLKEKNTERNKIIIMILIIILIMINKLYS